MFEAKDEIKLLVESLWRMSSKYDRGQIIPWGEVEKITGPRREQQADTAIIKWRRWLERKREVVTLVAPTIGVRLLTHEECAEEIPRIRQRKAFRQVKRALRETATVNTGALTMHERIVLEAQRQHMAATRRQLFRVLNSTPEKLAPMQPLVPRST